MKITDNRKVQSLCEVYTLKIGTYFVGPEQNLYIRLGQEEEDKSLETVLKVMSGVRIKLYKYIRVQPVHVEVIIKDNLDIKRNI